MSASDSRARLRALTYTSLAHAANDGMAIFLSFVAAFLATSKGAPPVVVTAVAVVANGASVLLSPLVGRWADRSGRPGALIGLGIAIVSTSLLGFFAGLAFATGIPLLLAIGVSAFLMGLGTAFYHPLGGSILQASFDDGSRGKALGINGALGSAGRALFPAMFSLAAVVLVGYDPFVLFAAIGFAAAVTVWLGLREQAAVGQKDAPERGRGRDVATRGVIVLTVVVLVRSLATQGIAYYIPTFLSIEKGLGVGATLFIAVTTVYAPAIVGQPFFGLLVDRYDKRLVLGLSSAGAALAIAGAVYAQGSLSIALLALFGFFTFSGFPLFFSLVADYVPRNSSSLGNGLVWGIGASGGSVFGPVVAGAIILTDYSRLGYAFDILAAVAMVSALGTFLIPKPHRSGKVPLFG